jgi:hypothetical protein
VAITSTNVLLAPALVGLLNRLTADGVLSVFRRQERQIMEPNQADLHRLETNGVALKAT